MPKRWNQHEIDILTQLYPDPNLTPDHLMQKLQCSWTTIQHRARLLGLRRRHTTPWSSTEIEELKRMHIDENIRAEDIMRHFGRS